MQEQLAMKGARKPRRTWRITYLDNGIGYTEEVSGETCTPGPKLIAVHDTIDGVHTLVFAAAAELVISLRLVSPRTSLGDTLAAITPPDRVQHDLRPGS